MGVRTSPRVPFALLICHSEIKTVIVIDDSLSVSGSLGSLRRLVDNLTRCKRVTSGRKPGKLSVALSTSPTNTDQKVLIFTSCTGMTMLQTCR